MVDVEKSRKKGCRTNLTTAETFPVSWSHVGIAGKDRFKPGFDEEFNPKRNQSRMCGKEVCLGRFPSDSFEPQPYNFDEIAHIEPLYGV